MALHRLILGGALAALTLLAGCGSDNFDRVSTGAGTGAATGAAIGIIGGPIGVFAGAVIGAGAGAVTGGTTTQKQIDMGKPVWEHADQANAGPPADGMQPGGMPPGDMQPAPQYSGPPPQVSTSPVAPVQSAPL